MDTDQIYRFNFVTDPDDPNITTSYNELIGLIESDKTILLTEDYLDRGLVRYNIDTIYNYNETPDHIEKIIELIGEVSYIPITASLKINKNNTNLGSIITGAGQIVKYLTEIIIKTKIINVESVRYEDVIIFNPITENNTAVYENPKYLAEYHNIVNMEILGGYQVLSDDPMVRYVLSELYETHDYVPSDINTIYVKNIALIPVGNNINEEGYYSNIIDNINMIIRKRRSEGYFVYHIGIHNLEDLELIRDLGYLWSTRIVYDEDMVNIVLQSDVDFGTTPNLWFRENLSIIKFGYFPSITLYGDWQFQTGDYNQIFGKEFYDSMLHYAGLLAYKKMSIKDDFIRPFTHTVKVNNDLSITLSVPTYNHVILFRKYLDEILNGYSGLEHNGSGTWMVEPCDSLIDGVIKRWHVQTIDGRAMPMVLYHVNEDGSKGEVLVFRSPVIGLYRADHPFNFDSIDMVEVKKDLTNNLKDYYKVCHNNIVSRDKMNLEYLLDLVEIKERPNQPIITARPLRDKILSKDMLMGLRGLFNVGPLKGLYNDMPEKLLVRPRVGTPLFNKVERLYETGDIYEIEIGFEDGTISPLFEIATSNISELEIVVKQLWEVGYFLNYWISSIQKYIPDIKSYSVIITNPTLLNAADSKSDGTKAMEYLKEMSQI